MGDYLRLRRPTMGIHPSGEEGSVRSWGGAPGFSRSVPLVAYRLGTWPTRTERWPRREVAL
jgi:hypothetical protein